MLEECGTLRERTKTTIDRRFCISGLKLRAALSFDSHFVTPLTPADGISLTKTTATPAARIDPAFALARLSQVV